MTNDFVMRVLNLFAMFPNDGINDMLLWRTDGEYAPITFMVECSDVFEWATADAEIITPDNIDDLEKAIREVREADPTCAWNGPVLFVARWRNRKPMRQILESYPKITHLFDGLGDS